MANAKALKKEMGGLRGKVSMSVVRNWLHDHDYQISVVVYAEQWAMQTGRLCYEQEKVLRDITPAQYVSLAVEVCNKIDYFSTRNAYHAWREILSREAGI